MTELQMMRQEQTKQVMNMRRYLHQLNVDLPLAIKIQQQVSTRIRSQRRLADKDVVALSLLSSQLRLELHINIFLPYMGMHSMLRSIEDIEFGFLRETCSDAAFYEFQYPGDMVFEARELASGCYRVAKGSLQYLPDRD